MGHSAPPVPLPPRDLSRPAAPAIDTIRPKYTAVYAAVAVLIAASIVGGVVYSLTVGKPPKSETVLLLPARTTFALAPGGHASFGPRDLTSHSLWNLHGSFNTHSSNEISYCLLDSAAFSAWQGSGYPTSGCNSGTVGGPAVAITGAVSGGVYDLAWVDLDTVHNATITVVSNVTASSVT